MNTTSASSSSHLNAAFSSKYSNRNFRAKIVNVLSTNDDVVIFDILNKQLAGNEIRRWTSILGNSETACTSITPYVEFLMNSRLKKVSLHCRCCIGILTAFLRRMNHYLSGSSSMAATTRHGNIRSKPLPNNKIKEKRSKERQRIYS